MKHYPLLALLNAEHYKTKNNIAVLLFLLSPFVVTLLAFGMSIGNSSEFPVNPWIALISKKLLILYLFYPFLASILIYSLCDLEYRNSNFRRLFTLPYSVHAIFTSKILFLIEIVFFSTLIAYLSFILSAFILSYLSPESSFQDYDMRLACFYLHVRLFIGLLAVSSIQYWLSLIFRNFVIPIGFSGFMVIFSLFSFLSMNTMNVEYRYFNPFGAILTSLNDFISYQSVSLTKYVYVCLVYIFVFLLINLFTFKWRKYNN